MREGGDVRRRVGGDISIAFSIDGYDIKFDSLLDTHLF
jgi:hypothetical protein